MTSSGSWLICAIAETSSVEIGRGIFEDRRSKFPAMMDWTMIYRRHRYLSECDNEDQATIKSLQRLVKKRYGLCVDEQEI